MLEIFIIGTILILAFVWICLFSMYVYYKLKEEKIHTILRKEENEIKEQAIDESIIQSQIESLRKKHKPQLEKIEKRKQLLRDILYITVY